MEFHLIRIYMHLIPGLDRVGHDSEFFSPERRSSEVKRVGIGNPGKHIGCKEGTGL